MLQERDNGKDGQINTEDIIIEIQQIITKNEQMLIERIIVDTKITPKKQEMMEQKKKLSSNS